MIRASGSFLTKGLITTIGLPVMVAASLLGTQTVLAAGLDSKLANHLVIAAVKPGSFFQEEYIELYNPTSAAINAAGLNVHVKATDGTDQVKTLTPVAGHATMIPAGGYYLIASSASSVAPQSDATYDWTTGQLIDNSSVYISNSADAGVAVIDLVGWGTAAAGGFETTPATNPSVTQVLERMPGAGLNEGNGIDTNNNAADFVVRDAVAVKNTASTVEFAANPVISNITPANGSFVTSGTLTVSAKVTDAGSGIANASAIQLWIDGQSHGPVTYDPATGIASRVVTVGEGTHTATFIVTDPIGFSSVQSSSFTVDTIAPTLSLTITDSAPTTTKLATTVKLTANDDPAGKASGLKEMRIAFDGVLDNEPWEPFQATVTRNLMNKAGLQAIVAQVRDQAGNVSNSASATTTFVVGATKPLASPTSPLSSTVGNKITLTWNPVAGATTYLVRYSNGQVLFGPFTVTGTTFTVSELDPTKKFSFEVAAINTSGTVSPFVKVTPEAPVAPAVTTTASTENNPTGGPVEPARLTQGNSAPFESLAPTPTPSVSPSIAPSPTPSTGEIKSSQDSQPRDWTRVIVALSILIIAAGVATGGWYLYQWWTTRDGAGTGKGKSKGGRW